MATAQKNILFFIIIALVSAVLYFKFGVKGSPEVIVLLKDDSFDPETIVIKKETRVIFKNIAAKPHWPASNLHPTHGIYPEFDPLKGVEPGQAWSFVFKKVGKWRYHDHLFPSVTGTIDVEE